jgi:hypothetical protein
MKTALLRAGVCLALALGSSMAHAEYVDWRATGTVSLVNTGDPQLPFPVVNGDSVVLDMVVDTTVSGSLTETQQMTYDNVVSATINIEGHTLAFNSSSGNPGWVNVDDNMPFGNGQYLNGISMSAEDSTSHVEASWYLQTVGGLNTTPITSLNMPQQPPNIGAFANAGIEVWPEGDVS